MLNFKRNDLFIVGTVMVSFLWGCGDVCTAVGPGGTLPSGNYHPLVNGHMPPGVVGRSRLASQQPVAGYFQPIKFSGPRGTQFALPQGGAMSPGQPNLMAGLLIGNVYRFKITGIPSAPGAELFPTLELIDRTYPPPGLATSFPIPINLDQTDLDEALNGQMVTRVIYLEDQQTAAPLPTQPDNTQAMEVAHHQDPLEIADRLGRPVAIVRIGSLAPPTQPHLMPQFYFGYPTWAPIYQPEPSDVRTPAPAGAIPGTTSDAFISAP
tara:strand:+ start:26815 stop:27612 length:798 start_codon:yes stop_codon:yes gene_type:complete